MDCRTSVDLMAQRLDGLLDPPDITRLEEHLPRCASCAEEWAALREADSLLRLAARRPVTPPIDFQARVMLRVAVTPVIRPQLWERQRQQIQGGRRTVRLPAAAPIAGRAVPAPAFAAIPAAPRSGLGGFAQHFHPLRSLPMGVYLGALSVGGALSALLLVLAGVLWASGLVGAPQGMQMVLGGNVEVAHTWLVNLWALATGLLAQIDPWMAGVATLVVAGLGAAWWRIVAAFARRTGEREVIA